MIPRNEVVLSVLGELQEATESSGLDVLNGVALEVEQVLAPFQLPKTPCRNFLDWTGIDEVAHGLYPPDSPGDLLPLNCKGEGNRLFDAVSMLLVGTTGLSLELQVRTVVEMVVWKRYYLSGMIDSKMMLQAVRFSLCAEESEDMVNLPVAVLEAIFDADVKASCFPGSYANMWHVYALSSVLQFNIYSIYPMFNLKIRPYFNRVVRPRSCPKDLDLVTLHIMWSGELQLGSLFRPNHFVPLVQTTDLTFGSPNSEQVRPVTSEMQLPQDSHLSYSNLKDKYNITKRTFYRWKRQTQEHCKKSAARYEAKHFLQTCYLEGKLIPLHQFKEMFPEISRSSYYNWKHELLKSGGNFSTSSSTGEISPGESTEQEVWSSPEAKQDEQENHGSVARMFGVSLGKLDLERAQNVAHMQEAKRCLQNCIAMNSSLPFRIFKRNFPGISRSTYYNWRREALVFNRGYKGPAGSSEDSSDADKSQSHNHISQLLPNANQAVLPKMRICRQKHRSFNLAYMSKKQLRDAAKLHVQKSKLSLTKFKLKFPSMSPCFYWLWRSGPTRKRKKKLIPHTPAISVPESLNDTATKSTMGEGKIDGPSMFPFVGNRPCLLGSTMASFNASRSKHMYGGMAPINEQMFAMDVVALANFKARAKLFLQQRFEEKSFPTFKEFRSYFPFTPRSTYYMWKRALHHGVSLVHG
ncbi:vertnin [Thalassophryne amazonica]|uniref:vertnin n=1 Tax=Thalassophryne amazonica TaxID=390379 RepID=UPI00147111F8|nr:vertnin [Thalassophryne amazonica]XP_034018407.1 vertnin [Thalassophryne amazonica]XP_034018408.1 vertnin [Thalassophryne amazonica]